MKKIEIESQINEKEYIKLMYTITYRRPIMIILTVVGVFMLFLGIRYVIVFDKWEDIPFQMLIFGFAISILLPIFMYWSSKRSFNATPRIREKMIYTFDTEEIHILGESFNSSMSWDKVFKIRETKEWLLLYQNKIVANLIPKSSFSTEEYSALKEIIAAHPALNTKLKS
ncbi:MAG: YcxB family protein [Bacteroidota bacterium]